MRYPVITLCAALALISASLTEAVAAAAQLAPSTPAARRGASQETRVLNAELLALWSDPADRFMLAGGEDGALLRSEDGGQHWQQAPIAGSSKLSSFAGSPGGTLLAVTDDRLLRSTDQGRTWTSPSLPRDQHVTRVLFHPKSASWIATTGSGILQSKDDGQNWNPVYLSPVDTPLLTLTTTPKGVLFAAGTQGALLRSADGNHWTVLATQSGAQISRFLVLPGQAGVLSLWADGSVIGVRPDGTHLWRSSTGKTEYLSAVTYDAHRRQVLVANAVGQVFRSHDDGRSWQASTVADRAYIAALNVDDRSGDILALGARADIARSSDGGATWQLEAGNAWTSRINALTVDQSGDNLVAVGSGGLVLRSADRGHSWTTRHADLNHYVSEVMSVPASKALVAIGADGFLIRSTNGGIDWSVVQTGMPAPVSLLSLIYVPRSGTLFASGPMSSVISSRDAAQTWKVTQPVPDAGQGFFSQIVATPDSGALLAIGSPGRIMQSNDGGHSWRATNADTSSEVTAVVAAGNGIVIAGRRDGKVLRSIDDGTQWQSNNTLPGAVRGGYLDAQTNSLWLLGAGVLARSNDGGAHWQNAAIPSAVKLNFMTRSLSTKTLLAFGETGAILRSTDNGASWKQITGVTSSSLRKPLIDPMTGAIYVPGRDGTLLRSTDEGVHWTPIPTHTKAHLNRIALDADTRSLIVTGERIVRVPLR